MYTVTSIGDVGRSVARLSILAAANPQSVPDFVHISGDVTSLKRVADKVGEIMGEPIQMHGGDAPVYLEKLTKKERRCGCANTLR